MIRLFVRLFLVVALSMVISNQLLDEIYEKVVGTPVDHGRAILEKSVRTFARAYLSVSAENIEKNIEVLEKSIRVPVSIEPVDSWPLPDEELALLNEGKIIDLESEEGDTLLFKLKNQDRVISLGPFPKIKKFRHWEVTFSILFFLILAASLLLWIWPHWRSLEKLSAASRAFGRGDLNARASLHRKSAVINFAKTFNSMAEKIQELIQSHKHLTSAVAHELRTPISRMQFGLEMLDVNDPENAKRYIKDMKMDIQELDKLITEMMTYARLERGFPSIKLEESNLVSMINQVIEKVQPSHSNIQLDFDYPQSLKSITVKCYSHYLERAILNLVNNALRYAKETIRIELFDKKKTLYICVDDDGPGIPKELRSDVFQPFKRLDTDNVNTNFGLGLTIVEQIAKWHDGKIEILDSPLGGARFQFSWPYLDVQTRFPKR